MTTLLCEVCKSKNIYHISVRANLNYIICRSCGHAFLVIPGESMQEFFLAMQKKYFGEDTVLLNSSMSPQEDEMMVKRRSVFTRFVKSPSQVLEVGPGAGSFIRWANEQGHWVTAVEDSSNLAKALRHIIGASIFVGSFENSDLPCLSQDVFCSFHVIEHVPDPRSHLVTAARIVRPGGLAFIATPNGTSWEQRFLPTLSPNFDSAHLRVFSLKSLCKLAEDTGWSVEWYETPEYTQGWMRVISKALRKLRSEDEEATAGKYGSFMSRKPMVYELLKIFTIPFRFLQSSFLCGNEIFMVLRRNS